MLRAVAAGVYDKIPGDGREFCVTVPETISIRAEDGRYVNNCNVSAFISNLPSPPGVNETIDTTQFSSGEASGSTSQAANVAEAIEMGAKVFLVDEDVRFVVMGDVGCWQWRQSTNACIATKTTSVPPILWLEMDA